MGEKREEEKRKKGGTAIKREGVFLAGCAWASGF